jgi:hypothetical protein
MLLEYLIILPQNRYSSTRKLVLVINEKLRLVLVINQYVGLHLVKCRIENQGFGDRQRV